MERILYTAAAVACALALATVATGARTATPGVTATEVVIGGTIPGGRNTTAHELRGPKIDGGERQPLHAGDVVHIGAKTPHQILLEPGHTLDYFAVKVYAR